MGNVVVLDELTACKIAAGEVIERPASVVKELVENSIDAGATDIRTEITSGGIRMIKVTDNGCGFMKDDALIAFDKHATSKIRFADDLETVCTLGFRGEALASIAAVSEVTLVSKSKEESEGITVRIKGGTPEYCRETGCNYGTCITVRDLFYNTPARYKFLKRDATEAGYVADVIEKIAMAQPGISFTLESAGKQILHTPGNGDLMSTIYSIFGKQTASSLLKAEFTSSDGKISVSGFVGTSGAVYKTRARQYFYVNGRCVKNKFLSAALDESVKTSVMKGMFPFAVLNITVPVKDLDVNVHPMKSEVRFADESAVFSCIYSAVHGVFTGDTQIPVENNTFYMQNNTFGEPSKGKSVHDYSPVFSSRSQHVSDYSPDARPDVRKNISESSSGSMTEDNRKAIKEFLDSLKTDNSVKESSDMPFQSSEPVKENTLINMSPLSDTSTESADIFESAQIVGQIFDTYILLEKGGELFIIDQHAAHERLMYEDIKYIIETKKYNTQMLLSPITVNLSKSEFALASDNLGYFENMGFELENFGGDTIIVRAVPSILVDSSISEFIAEGIACMREGTEKKFFSDKAVYTMACKAAVKGNTHLDYSEIEALLKRLSSLSGPATCPHGRPFYIKVTRQDLDKKFKRIL